MEIGSGNMKADERISVSSSLYGAGYILASILFICLFQPTCSFFSHRVGLAGLRPSLGGKVRNRPKVLDDALGSLQHTPSATSCRCRVEQYMSGTTSEDDGFSFKLSPEILQESLRSRELGMIDLNEEKHLKVYAISDLHSDYRQSLSWVKTWEDYKEDGVHSVLIVGGDLSGDLHILQSTLMSCKEKFDDVFFVAGNHDLWVQPLFGQSVGFSGSDDAGNPRNSLHKLMDLVATCDRLGVHVSPVCFSGMPNAAHPGVWVFPLLSWYHASWDKEPDLPEEVYEMVYAGRPEFSRRWADFRNCNWPEIVCSKEDFTSIDSESTALAEYFACLNKPWIRRFEAHQEARALASDPSAPYSFVSSAPAKDYVISFSHFLPRQELCPEKRFLMEPGIPKVIGSDPLERQIRYIDSDLHIFGHTHIPIDLVIKGVRYMTWPLGSAREHNRQCRPIMEHGPLLVYNSLQGGKQPVQSTMWGDYYRANERDVQETEPASWVLKAVELRQRR